MKPIFLSEDEKINLFQKFFDKFKKELDNFSLGTSDTTLSVKTNFCTELKDKITILYTPEAYLRMQALVDFFNTEVAWYGLVDKVSDKVYRVYDVKLCKQYVNGAKVDTEDDDVLEFFDGLTDDEIEHMHFQAHSHVKMSTGASGIDLQNQADVIKNMGKTGFYIFQIWNKAGDINTYLYDLDANTAYDRKDIVIEIEDSLGTIDDFLGSVIDLVAEKKYPYAGKKDGFADKKEEKKEEKEHTYLDGYYDGYSNYGNYGRWDW